MADHTSSHDSSANDEPSTPLWVTLLGATLLVASAVYMLFPSGESTPSGSPSANTNAAPAK